MYVLPHINPMAFYIGPLAVPWYYLLYGLGFFAALILGIRRARRPDSGWRVWQVALFIGLAVPALMVGARLGYVFFYHARFFMDHPERIHRFWEGGMSFHGGFIGILAAVALTGLFARKRFYQVTDFIAPLAPLGLMAGRIGNFINAELWGRPAEAAWAVVFPTRLAGRIPRHPSQLYEAFFEGLLLFIILWLYSQKPRPRGAVSGLFLLLYGGFRFVIEFYREPDRHLGFIAFDWMTMGQLLCLPLVLWGAALLFLAFRPREMPPAER